MSDKPLKATFGDPDHPLKVAGAEIPCYVLEDGTSVLSQRGMVSALGMSYGSYKTGADRLTRFISGNRLKAYISNELTHRIENPIRFTHPRGGGIAFGYEATILHDVCEATVAAWREGKLQKQQAHIAERSEILIRSWAKVGIIALVHEATGYQEARARKALEEILEKFIAKELRKWAKTFPDEFYKEMFRLKGWQYLPFSVKRPGYVGTLTNDLVYQRLAPGVLDELKQITPKDSKGRRTHRYHQWLTEDVGHPRLREHLSAVIALMKASTRWGHFHRSIQRALPKYHANLELILADEEGESV